MLSTAYGLTAEAPTNQHLFTFDTEAPAATASAPIPITGTGGDTLEAIDFRPATGQLLALGQETGAGHLYSINPATGVATQLRTTGLITLRGSAWGFDVDPATDEVRIVGNTGQNLRVTHLDTTRAVVADPDLFFAAPGRAPAVVGIASTSDPGGASRLYGYDYTGGMAGGDNLVRIGSDGTVTLVGHTGVTVNAGAPGTEHDVGLDIRASDNAAFAVLRPAGIGRNRLYTVELGTGAAHEVGTVGDGTRDVRDFALSLASPGRLEFSAASFAVFENAGAAVVTVNRVGGSDGPVSVNWAVSGGTATAGADYSGPVTGTLRWAAGDSSPKTITIPIAADALVESAEAITLRLSSPTGGATLGSQTTATVVIHDSVGEPAREISRFVTISRGRVRRRHDGRYRQVLRLTFTGPAPEAGPIRLVVFSLRPRVRLLRPAGRTQVHPLLPDYPYVFVDVGPDHLFSPGETSRPVVLSFNRRPNRDYATDVHAGGV